MKKVGKRLRRTAEEAQKQILDAAEELLCTAGPAGIRLQDVAKTVGVSHPTILHHFGSRGGLVQAVIERSMEKLYADLVKSVQQEEGEVEPRDVLRQVYECLTEQGHARVLAWLILSNHEVVVGGERLSRFAEVVHALRKERWRHPDQPVPEFEDTLFTVILGAAVFFGDALAGNALMGETHLANQEDARDRFRDWFSDLLMTKLQGGSFAPDAETAPVAGE